MENHASAENSTDPVYFWKENKENGYMCQWYISKFTAPAHPASTNQDPVTFSSTEQYMMYHKAMAFNDVQIAAQIMAISDPKQIKAKGRKVKGFYDEKWNEIREKIVEDGNWFKFTAAKDVKEAEFLKAELLKTGDKLLVEASPYDSIWGIGFTAEHAEKNRPHWGLNLLGEALMKVRTRIRK